MAPARLEEPGRADTRLAELFEAQRKNIWRMADRTAAERAVRLHAIGDYLDDDVRLASLLDALRGDLGKCEAEALGECLWVKLHIRLVRRSLPGWMRPRRVSTPWYLAGSSCRVHARPKGTTLILSPWNYPFLLAMMPVISAIAAGNTVVLKPSEHAPLTRDFIAQMLHDLFDPDEVAVVEGGPEAAEALLGFPFNHIFFTGNPQTGRRVMEAASKNLASVTLELGGKSPAIADATCRLPEFAARVAHTKFVNCGQTCLAPDYCLVHASRLAEFVEGLRGAVRRFYGDSAGPHQDYGRIVNEGHMERLVALLEDAIRKGAKPATGGRFDRAGRQMEPTVLVGVTEDMRVMQEEIFGPILPVIPFGDRDEAVDLINRRPIPLGIYIGTRDRSFARHVKSRARAGAVVVNHCGIQYLNLNLPFGGQNESGLGRANGHAGFLEFSNQQAVMNVRSWSLFREPTPPYPRWLVAILKRLRRII